LDGLLVRDESVPHNAVVPARPIGVLYMVDDGEKDEKVVLVPAKDISKDHIKDLDDLGENWKKMVEHYYSHYKEWKNDWKGSEVVLNGWGNVKAAKKIIEESIERAKKQ
jgi:inorganic pyrophosphatase